MTFKHWYVAINSVILGIGLLIFGYWCFLDGNINPVIVYKSDSFALQTDKTVYHRGEVVYIQFSFCKYRRIPATVNWRLVDGQVILFSPIQKDIPIGCYGDDKPYLTSTIRIPMNAPLGVWHLEGTVFYVINPIKTQEQESKTMNFTIIE